jgi:hypothetical protein
MVCTGIARVRAGLTMALALGSRYGEAVLAA